jgi:pantothenate kinase
MGLAQLVARLRSEVEVIYPLFDRERDIAVAGAGLVSADCDCVLVEGNYLLFDEPGWRELAALWDVSVRLSVPEDLLRTRLVQRWRDHGLADEAAEDRAERNDLANARRVLAAPLPADLTWG